MKKNQMSVAVAALIFLFATKAACAENDYIIYSPHVVEGQSEVETYGFYTLDGRSNLNTASGQNISIAHAFTSWWKTELYVGEFNRDPGGSTHPSGYELENTFQLTAPGEYWADIGFLAAYAYAKQPGVGNGFEFGPLLEKLSGHIDQRLNLIWTLPVGGEYSGLNQFRSSYSISYNIHYNKATFSPGIEVYSRPNDNAYQIGPVFYGEYRTDEGSELEYSLGVVYGINQAAPAQTLLARLEYGFF
ncbi:MAG: Uncharacterized protein AWT59_0616 [Candidatus Gallionella acididurans]|uniref:Lipoprotein n=1 Tax=Candidatus Gallionella acididurans TaxID=1796491 RepID=A0A139BWM6_9PROT|nr:MAG: Uncharacterized protein AWT59_0616 [Candidatus Gallionella acididurans]